VVLMQGLNISQTMSSKATKGKSLDTGDTHWSSVVKGGGCFQSDLHRRRQSRIKNYTSIGQGVRVSYFLVFVHSQRIVLLRVTVCWSRVHVCVCLWMGACVHAYMRTCVHAFARVRVHLCLHAYMRMYGCVHLCGHVCTCVISEWTEVTKMCWI